MKAYFTRAYTISASHRLHTDALSEEANKATFGKCNNPHGHGHNYRIEVTIAGPVDVETGMVINMATLDSVVHKEVVERFDHMNLNLDPLFAEKVSTTENLSIAIFDLLSSALKPAILEKVRIEETENNFFEYSGG
ncbi:MAG TPA: 6-carboxytetrahydropterin synthase [Acidobacteriaceae bacterium]|jgi:6-pyruvoyltetrahydropterin/6-carboxytetrahydropterin synthase|nr:6-carboxytetrahydropterin synthase [Acidobacteriaceae bacterium]